jgi:hypothetical protein
VKSVALACVAADDAADIAGVKCVACPVKLHPLLFVAADGCVACYHALQANPATLAPYIVRICEAAATPLMGGVRVSRSLQENAAITLGRAAMVCPDQVMCCSVW